MKKVITSISLFLFLISCGHTPIYSNKNFNLKFSNIIYNENNRLEQKIEKKLRSFSNDQSQEIFAIKIDADKKINTLSKDNKGNPSRYEMAIEIKVEIILARKETVKKTFYERFNYKTNINRFELKLYEKEIENLLINKNIENIISYLLGYKNDS